MNTAMMNSYSYKERYEALSFDQGLELMCSNKMLGKPNCVESENRC